MNVHELAASLSVQEKVGQLNQRLKGWDCVHRSASGWQVTDTLRREVDRFGGLGALYGLFRADPWSGVTAPNAIGPAERYEVAQMVSEYCVQHSNHGIAPLLAEEAPHGHMAFGGGLYPVNLAIGASWDLDGAREAAMLTAQELRASGAHLALVSGLDIARDPRWGRGEECYGEDPDHAAAFVDAIVRGMNTVPGIGVVLKHFAGQGAGIGGRNGSSAPIGPRELGQIHLPAARAGVRAGAVAMMAAYNDIDGVPCIASRDLLTGVLRDRWGFDGIVMADGGAIDRLLRLVGSAPAAAAAAVRAGVDLSLWDESFTALPEAVDTGMLDIRDLDQAVGRVLRLKQRLGVFPGTAAPAAELPMRERVEIVSTRLARHSIVSLIRGEAIPLTGRVAVVGPGADDAPTLLGDYTPPTGSEVRGVATALAARLGDERVRQPVRNHGRSGSRWIMDAADRATWSGVDAIVAVVGDTSERLYATEFEDNGAARPDSVANIATCGEGVDTAGLRLPETQLELLRTAAASGLPVVAVVVAGRARVLAEVFDLCDSVLYVPYPGPQGAEAVVDVLVGEVTPSGRLPISLPLAEGSLPVAHNERLETARGYADRRAGAIPFGTGGPPGCDVDRALRLPLAQVSATDLRAGVTMTALLRLHNTGTGTVRDVVPIYGSRQLAGVQHRRNELLTFVTAVLEPGETIELEVPLGVEDLAVRDADGVPCVMPVRVLVGLRRDLAVAPEAADMRIEITA